MSRLSLTAGAACALLAAALTNAQTAPDAPWVKLVHTDTGKVLSVADKSEEPAARVVLAKDDGSEFQQWKLVKDGNYYKVVNRKTGQVLDVFEESLDEGTDIIQWPDKPEGND